MSKAEMLKIKLEEMIEANEISLTDPVMVDLSQQLDRAMNEEGGVLR